MSEVETLAHAGIDCSILWNACTPRLYSSNMFRLAAVPVDSKPRELKKRLDDIKDALELGATPEKWFTALPLREPLTNELVREALRHSKDAQLRFIDELFWFWPMRWAQVDDDPGMVAVIEGSTNAAYKQWQSLLSDPHSPTRIIAKHNLAVLAHASALDYEQMAQAAPLSPDRRSRLKTYWEKAVHWWGELNADDDFWTVVTQRLRDIDDPQLTTGWTRRLRATVGPALARINVALAVNAVALGRLEDAGLHMATIAHLRIPDSQRDAVLQITTEPQQIRIRSAVERALATSGREPAQADKAAVELVEATAEPISAIRFIFPTGAQRRVDLCNSVAEAGLRCQVDFGKKTEDWSRCVDLLKVALPFAESAAVRKLLEDNLRIVLHNRDTKPIVDACADATSRASAEPEKAIVVARSLISRLPEFDQLISNAGLDPGDRSEMRDLVARVIMNCAIAYGNRCKKWSECVPLLNQALDLASDTELRKQIEGNRDIAQSNQVIGDQLRPISSAPSLSTINGCGFRLYGKSEVDAGSNSYVATYYFVLLLIPILPIARYRVIRDDQGYRFLGRVPLRGIDWVHIAAAGIAVLWMFVGPDWSGPTTSTAPTSYPGAPANYGTYTAPAETQSRTPLRLLASQIDADKSRARALESQIRQLDARLESERASLDAFRAADDAASVDVRPELTHLEG